MRARESFVPEDVLFELRRLSVGPSPSLAERASIILFSAQGRTADDISAALGVVPLTVYKWRKRFREMGVEGLRDLPRPGQPRKLSDGKLEAIIRVTRDEVPADATRWSIRRVAQVASATEYQVRTAWDVFDIASERMAAPTVSHQLRPSGREVEIRGVLLSPPWGIAVIGLGPSEQRGDRVSTRPPSMRTQSGTREGRHRSDGLFSAFHAAREAAELNAAPDAAPGAESAVAFVKQALSRAGSAQELRIVLSHDVMAEEPGMREVLEASGVKVHGLRSAVSFLAVIEDLTRLLEVRARAPFGGAGVFDLRRAIEQFVAGAQGHRRAPFRWLAGEPAPAQAVVVADGAPASGDGQAPANPLSGPVGPVGWTPLGWSNMASGQAGARG